MSDSNKTGAENYRWNLSCFYAGLDDPQIEADLKTVEAKAPAFATAFKGQLKEKLGPALEALAAWEMLVNKIMAYLQQSHDVALDDGRLTAKLAEAEQRISSAQGESLEFFDIELASLEQADIDRQAAVNAVVKKHLPYIAAKRRRRDHLLSEAVESVLTKISPFGPSAWSKFFQEMEADLRFAYDGKKLSMEEILDVLTESPDPDVRADALKIFNDGLKGTFAKYSAQTLYQTAGFKAIEDGERKYGHPMAERNQDNNVPDATVEALHAAVMAECPALVQRHYRLKAARLGLKLPLRWSDRNAKLPQEDGGLAPFDETLRLVEEAYTAFSPTLGGLVRQIIAAGWIDAPVLPGRKDSGAYSSTVILPDFGPVSCLKLNYQGSLRDKMTTAHELGHGAHGLWAGKAQGQLMYQAPIAYCETASVFGEMLTFRHLKRQLANDPKRLLALIMGKTDDMVNTIVRQISFSNFERRLHGAGRKLSVEELCGIWLDCTRELYGQDGDVFTYEDADHLWAYVSHFNDPFYVYGYAFGELLTHSLFAQHDRLGDRFEPLYLDLLGAGNTKDAKELLAPIGLDPTDSEFWSTGLRLSLGSFVAEAEQLSASVGLGI